MTHVQTKDLRDAIFDEVYHIIQNDQNVILLVADMGVLSLKKLQKDYPNQYFNIGISEQNMICVAAGLALSGKRVIMYSIAPFVTMRCYEQIKVLLSDMNLNVVIIGGGAGFTYGNDGGTHHSIQDIPIMRAMDNMVIYNPCDAASSIFAIRQAYTNENPTYIRMGKGSVLPIYADIDELNLGVSEIKKGKGISIISTGVITSQAIKVRELLRDDGIDAQIINVFCLNSLKANILTEILGDIRNIFTVEENVLSGGIGSVVCEQLGGLKEKYCINRIGVENPSLLDAYGSREWLYEQFGLSVDQIYKKIRYSLIK